jgi:hypothetical protein
LLSFGAETLFICLLSKNIQTTIYRTIILPIILYGFDTWSLTLREERWLRVFENRVLRRIFGPEREAVIGEWRKVHNEELNDQYSSPNIIHMTKSMGRACSGCGGKGEAYTGYGGET